MSRFSTNSDEITLRATPTVYGVKLRIMSTLGQHTMSDINLDTLSRGLITIGSFDKENGIVMLS